VLFTVNTDAVKDLNIFALWVIIACVFLLALFVSLIVELLLLSTTAPATAAIATELDLSAFLDDVGLTSSSSSSFNQSSSSSNPNAAATFLFALSGLYHFPDLISSKALPIPSVTKGL
jgi:hypothetical protein